MATPYYYPQFAAVTVNANGFRQVLASETFDVYNVTTAASVGTVTSDADGIIAEGYFTESLNDIIEISHSSYAGLCRFTLADTPANAYLLNNVLVYVGEDLYAVETESIGGELIVTDNNNPDVPPLSLGFVKAGQDAVIPYQTAITKNLRVRLISRDVDQGKPSIALEDAPYQDITIPGIAPSSSPRSLWDHFVDGVSTAPAATETLWVNQIDAGTLVANGDKITLEYAGIFAANADNKQVIIDFNGTTIADTGMVTENGSHWKIAITIIRVSPSTVRFVALADTLVHLTPQYSQITSLDLDAADYDVSLSVNADDAPGDVTAKMGYAIFTPAATTGTEWLTDEDSDVILDEYADEISEG